MAAKGKTMADSGYDSEVKAIQAFLSMQHPASQPVINPATLDIRVEDYVAARFLRKGKSKVSTLIVIFFCIHGMKQSDESEFYPQKILLLNSDGELLYFIQNYLLYLRIQLQCDGGDSDCQIFQNTESDSFQVMMVCRNLFVPSYNDFYFRLIFVHFICKKTGKSTLYYMY